MDVRRECIFIWFLCIFILSIDASKCPESRKPHVTSCTIFYNCINLPEGGYVWAPAKCPDGLVFQPYLRICVLPGDTWTCDDSTTESSPTDGIYEIPESTDSVRTSYLGYDEDKSSINSRPIDESSDLGNVRRVGTPYPLIEIVDTDRKTINDNDKVIENVPQTIEHRMENYLYEFFNSQQKFSTPLATTIDDKRHENHSTWLRGFINRMLFYENVGETSKQQTYLSKPVIARITRTTTCEPFPETGQKKNENLDNFNSDVLSYIVQSYILGMKQSDVKLKKKNKKSTTTTTTTTTEMNEHSDEEIFSITENSLERPLNLIVDGSKGDNNIVGIRGNLGGKEYITVDKYKNLSDSMRLEVLEILPCAKGVRLPNRTDCTRYYSCDPTTAMVVQFSCSSRTAFNDYKRICEARRYRNCVEKLNASAVSTNDETIASTLATTRTVTTLDKNPCRTTGKFVDPENDRNYYVCYSSQAKSGRIDSIIMTCPNELIFCQERRLCTTRKRCYD